MPTLSLAMIVKNEEKTLPKLLESCQGVFDEICITDTGSTDRTVEIAKSFGAKVYDFPWIDDFAAARNFSFSKVTSEWTMWMDSVTGDTPVLVRRKGSRYVEYIEIRDLLPPSVCEGDRLVYVRSDYEVLTHQGWQLIRKIKQHRVKKPVLRIVDDGDVRVTRDHSLMSGGRAMPGSDVKIGTQLDHHKGPDVGLHENTMALDLAEAWGFFAAEGWASDINEKSGRGLWAVYNTNKKLLIRMKAILEAAHTRSFRFVLSSPGTERNKACWRLEPQFPRELAIIYRPLFYSAGGRKKVPREILNGTADIKKAFIRGFEAGDGYVRRVAQDGRELQSWSVNSPILAAGLFYLYRSIGRDLHCNPPRPDKPTIISCIERSNAPTNRSKVTNATAVQIKTLYKQGIAVEKISSICKVDKANIYKILQNRMKYFSDVDVATEIAESKKPNRKVRSISEDKDFDGWVYDLNTKAGTFVGGVGDFVLHNSDDILRPDDRLKLIALKAELGKADAYLMMYDYAQDEFDRPICRFYRHRILRTNPRVRWQLPIHEHLVIVPGTREAMTNVVVTHRRTGDAAAQDKGRNIRLLRKAVEQYPDNQRVKFYLGKELYSEGTQEECVRVLEEYLTKGDWHDNQVNACFWLAMSYLTQKKEDKAIDAALRGIKLDPRWAEFYCLIGQVYYDRSDWGTAIRWFDIAASCPVPETWGTVIIDNYTWVPRDRLCKCWSSVGNLQKAYEWNEAALGYRPQDKRLQYNRQFLRDSLYDRLSPRPARLNLGSGGKPASGWRNCDLYPGAGVQFQMDQSLIPYDDGVVQAIRSEHALEHSDSHYKAEETVREWARALRYGGYLHLMVPDFDECCRKFVESEDRARKPGERWTPKEWYKYTIYGIQVGQAHEPDAGQYHRTGFTKPHLKRLLESSGFEVTKIENYDGFGTPSIEVEAIQTGKKPRVAWMLRSADENDPSTRIRRMNICRWLAKHGVASEVVPNYQIKDEGAVFSQVRNYDVVVFSFLSNLERRVMEKLNLSGVTTIIDYNEDLVDLHPEIAGCLEAAQLIVCCSKVLAEKAGRYGRTLVIPDAYETKATSFIGKAGKEPAPLPGLKAAVSAPHIG